MIEFGNFSLLVAFSISLVVMVFLFIGIKRKDWRYVEGAYRATRAVFFFMSIAVGILVYAFISNDFRIEYVSSFSEISLPTFYKFTGLWAGQEGSLLFWGWLLSLFTTIAISKDEKRPGAKHLPYALLFLNITVLFFLVLANFVTPPFKLNSVVPTDGYGLTPVLQNPGMVFHPPTLYLGYVGFAIPFSYAMAALITGELGDWWIKKTRAWTLFSWMFLTLGIIFGGWWAYRELGWGGVWAWDPVENSSLMPWFTATAFLHSVMIQERRGMLKIWNLCLIILTFALSVFGAFLTRSGIISSVHAFGQSRVGYVFLFFLINILAISIYFIAIRYKALKERNPKIESLVSRESSFLYNNILLVGLCFATFWGTIFPLISEAVKGVKISVGPPFFNTVNSPLFLFLVALMALCPILGWRSTSWKSAAKNLLLPTICMLLSLPVLYFVGVHGFMPMFFYAISLFVLVTLVREYYLGTKVAVKNDNQGWVTSLFSFALKNRRRYGGFLVHTGIVFMVVGLVGYGFFQFKEDFQMTPGQEIKVQNYKLRFKSLRSISGSNYEGGGAVIEVYRDGRFMATLQPERRIYQKDKSSTTEVAIMSHLEEDLYLILGGWEKGSIISLTVVVNPLLMWVWIGTGVIILGIIWAVFPVRIKDLELNSLATDYLILLRSTK
jgi:cytochrome c-type biogenesis protein CcmF